MTPISASVLDALLAVQALDLDLDRCRHRRTTLAERAELVAMDTQLAGLEQGLAASRTERDVVAQRQQALEHSLASVEQRAAELKRRLYGGTVSATRELQAMAAEVDSLTARASELESRALEVMEEGEPLDARVNALEDEKASLSAAQLALRERLATREAEVDAEIDALTATRTEAAADLPEELAVTYEKLRHRLGGIGAARLVGSRCGGCHLTLPATALDQLRHQRPGDVGFCEQCGRILVAAVTTS